MSARAADRHRPVRRVGQYAVLDRAQPPGSAGIGFEVDEQVHALTQANLTLLLVPVDYVRIDYAEGLSRLDLQLDRLVVFFVAPPWGEALDPHRGLDLARTTPPVAEIIDTVTNRFAVLRMLFAVQIHEDTTAASLAGLRNKLEWTARRDYARTARGTNHGVLLGTGNWKPPEPT